MKAIMISIRPQFVAKILNGEKKEECRITYPKDFEGWVYIYCTKGNPMGKFGDGLYHEITKGSHWSNGCSWNMPKIYLEGKVVARFYLKKVRKYTENDTIRSETIKDTCLTSQEIWQYAKGKPIYLWHIDDLEIFDKPKELSDFYNRYPKGDKPIGYKNYKLKAMKVLTKAPQSWGYIEL